MKSLLVLAASTMFASPGVSSWAAQAAPFCADAPPASIVVLPGEGRAYGGVGMQNRTLVDIAPGVEQSFAVSEGKLAGGYTTPWTLHFHTKFDEFSYILRGVFRTDMPDGAYRAVPAGAATYAPRLHAHRASVPGPEPVTLLSVTTAEQIISFKDAWKYADDPERLRDYLATTGTYFVADPARQKAAGVKPAPTGSSIVLPGEGRRFTANGAEIRMLADVPDGETRSFAIMSMALPAGYKGWPAYYSCRFDEFWYVLKGSIVVELDGAQKIIPAGAAVYSPRGARHRIASGSAPATVFSVISAGQLAVLEGAGDLRHDRDALRAYLAKSQIYFTDQPGACSKPS